MTTAAHVTEAPPPPEPRPRSCRIAIVGAGPYGLAAAEALRAGGAGDVVAFGEPMSFWDGHMPRGMLLRSPYVASSIGRPAAGLQLPDFEREHDLPPERPVSLSRFVEYGRWVQRTACPDLRRERIARISRDNGGFRLDLHDGEHLTAERVVVAAGIASFAHYPEPFDELPRTLVSHAVEHRDLGRFAGADVLVVGGGQSALESAALLHEHGANVEVAVRSTELYWLSRRWQHRVPLLSRALYAPPDVGPAGVSRLVAAPLAFRLAPRRLQTWMTRRALRAAGSAWLVDRLRDVPLVTGREPVRAEEANGRARVHFREGRAVEVDHVLLGTGYRVDISRYDFLAPDLVELVATADGYPVLARGFESSVPGLHFLGAPAAWSFGPLMRFVAGTPFAAKELARSVALAPESARGRST